MDQADVTSSAEFSPDKAYRYILTRSWPSMHGPGQKVCFIGLNPSKAGGVDNDPTIIREMNFAERWGFGGIIKVNLYGYVSTKAAKLRDVADPVGPGNDEAIRNAIESAAIVVPAWGGSLSKIDPRWQHRENPRCCAVIGITGRANLKVLGLTTMGQPRHPLFVKKAEPLVAWEGCDHD